MISRGIKRKKTILTRSWLRTWAIQPKKMVNAPPPRPPQPARHVFRTADGGPTGEKISIFENCPAFADADCTAARLARAAPPACRGDTFGGLLLQGDVLCCPSGSKEQNSTHRWTSQTKSNNVGPKQTQIYCYC